jgi:hypothetical protein
MIHVRLMMSAQLAYFQREAGASPRRGCLNYLFPTHRQQSMLLRFVSSYFGTIRPFHSHDHISTLSLQIGTAVILRRHHSLSPRWSTRDNCTLAVMAPKQATLGYVRSSQTTLGCDKIPVLHRDCYSNADNLQTENSLGNRTAL